MRNPKLVEMVFHHQREVPTPVTDTLPKFALASSRPQRWIQQFAIWVLRKTATNYGTIAFEKIVFNTDDLLKNLISQINCFDDQYHRLPTKILMGPEEFGTVLSNDDLKMLRSAVRFEMPVDYSVHTGEHTRPIYKFFNIPVEVVIHMKGILLL